VECWGGNCSSGGENPILETQYEVSCYSTHNRKSATLHKELKMIHRRMEEG
jgi:hypothetical protein